MPGKTSHELTITFDSQEDMINWLMYLEYHRKRLRCAEYEVIGKLVAEWKRSTKMENGVEVFDLTGKAKPKARKRKRDDDDGAAPKILAGGPGPA
jgi:hypothetical protein